MTLVFERSYPYLGAGAAAGLWWYFQVPFPSNEDFLSAALTLGSILTGFLATAQAILMGLQGTLVMEDLVESRYIDDLVAYLDQAVLLEFLFCILTLAGFFLDSSALGYGVAWAAFAAAGALGFLRVHMILVRVLQFAAHERVKK